MGLVALCLIVGGWFAVPIWLRESARERRRMIRHAIEHGRACRCRVR